MSVPTNLLNLVPGFTLDDMRLIQDTYAASHPAANGYVDLNYGSTYELRLLDILATQVPAAFASATLISPALQSMADRLNGNVAGGTDPSDPDYESLSGWTTATLPVPVTYNFGDLSNSVNKKNLPAIIVSSSLPGGEEIKRPSIGPMQQSDFNCYIYYVLEYEPSLQRQLEALRGAEVIASLLGTYTQDPVTFWQNGKVNFMQRAISDLRTGTGGSYLTGVVNFTCTHWQSFIPR